MKKKLIAIILALTLVFSFGLTACDFGGDTTYTLTLTAGTGGSVEGGGTYKKDASVTAVATADSGYAFEGWYDGATKITGAAASYTFSMPAKNYTLKAEFTVAGTQKETQAALTVTAVTGKCVGDAPFSLATTGGSGTGAVTYTQVSGENVAVVTAAGEVTIYNQGDIVVKATKAGDATYNPITSAEATITISPAPKQNQETLSVVEVNGKVYGDADFPLSTSGGNGTGAVTYTQVSGTDIATVTTQGAVTIKKAGSFTVKATKAADGTYNSASSAERTITIAKAAQDELTVNAVTGKMADSSAFDLATDGGSGTGAVTYTQVSGTDVATVTSAGRVTIIKAGSFTVKAAKAADVNYNSTESGEIAITILPAVDPQKQSQETLTITTVTGKKFGDGSFNLTTSGGSGTGAVTYELINGGSVVTLTAAGLVTIKTAGSFKVSATKAGDATYNAAVSAEINVTIAKINQATLTVNNVSGKKYGDSQFNLSVDGGSGSGAVAYTQVGGTDVATVSGLGQVTILKAGSFTVKATKAADVNYNVAESAEITIAIAKADQTITIIPVVNKKYNDDSFSLSTTTVKGTGTVTFTQTSGEDVATVSPEGLVEILKGGSFTVTATIAADVNYNSATSASITITILGINDTIDNAYAITLNEVADLSIDPPEEDWGYLYYSFVPSQTHMYLLVAQGAAEISGIAYINAFDSTKAAIYGSGDYGNGAVYYSLWIELTQGETYYFGVGITVAADFNFSIALSNRNFNHTQDNAIELFDTGTISMLTDKANECLYYSFTPTAAGIYRFSSIDGITAEKSIIVEYRLGATNMFSSLYTISGETTATNGKVEFTVELEAEKIYYISAIIFTEQTGIAYSFTFEKV